MSDNTNVFANLEEKNSGILQERRVARAVEHLARIRLAMTAQMMAVLDELPILKQQIDIDVDLMLLDGGFTDTEINTYINFAPLNNHRKTISENNVSFETVTGLLRTDEKALEVALRSIERDPTFGSSEIRDTVRRLHTNALPLHEKLFAASRTAFADAFSETNNQREASMRSKASALYRLMRKFSRVHSYLDSFPGRRERVTTAARYAPFAAKMIHLEDRLVSAAQEMFIELKSVFPGCERPIEDWAYIALERPIEAYLAQAYFSLDVMSRRHFLRRLPGERTEFFSWSSFDAIKFLSSIEERNDGRKARWLSSSDVRKLNAIDICAGAGGQALGLEAAGFIVHALVDSKRTLLETLSKNRKNWKVVESDFSKALSPNTILEWIDDRKLENNLDLISGSLPISPWAYRGDGTGELFSVTKQIVASLKPKAFFFETDEGFKAPRHRTFRQNLLQYYRNLGYRMKIWRLNASEFGIPQQRIRYYLVGIKDHYANVIPPQISFKTLLGASIWSTAFPDLSEYARHSLIKKYGQDVADIDLSKAKQSRSPVQVAYDIWAFNWLARYQRLAPDLGKSKFPPTGPTASAWAQAGFDPQLRSLPRIDDQYFAIVSNKAQLEKIKKSAQAPKLPISASILRAIQGIPPDWELDGDEGSQRQQLSGMRPPMMSLAIARQIHWALTGQSVDLNDPKVRRITSGRDRVLPSFVNDIASHPDPLRYRAQLWAYSQLDAKKHDQTAALDSSDDADE